MKTAHGQNRSCTLIRTYSNNAALSGADVDQVTESSPGCG
jgi:hypothetical protein